MRNRQNANKENINTIEQKTGIIYLKQSHPTAHIIQLAHERLKTLSQMQDKKDLLTRISKITFDDDSDDATFHTIVRSQYRIAKYILEHADIPVVSESIIITDDIYREDNIRKAFNTKKLSSYLQLTDIQKYLFARYGGTLIAYELAKLQNIKLEIYNDDVRWEDLVKDIEFSYSLLSAEDKRKADAKIDHTREYFSLQNAVASKEEKIIFIYGALHKIENVLPCVKNAYVIETIDTVDYSYLAKINYDLKSEGEEKFNKLRPALNCDTLASSFSNPLYFLIHEDQHYAKPFVALDLPDNDIRASSQNKEITSNSLIHEQNEQNFTLNRYNAVAGMMACGVLVFGLVNCCKRSEKQQVEVINEQTSTQKSTAYPSGSMKKKN